MKIKYIIYVEVVVLLTETAAQQRLMKKAKTLNKKTVANLLWVVQMKTVADFFLQLINVVYVKVTLAPSV